VATCEVINTPSARVLERAGMIRAETYMHLERGFMEIPYYRYEIDKTRYETEVSS
jgi:RimJ/RimL family protein N-acetyltransferase